MEQDQQDNYVLVTGAAKRIGRTIAIYLAKHGLNIIIHYNSSYQEAKELQADLQNLGVKCLLVKADLNSNQQIEQMFLELKAKKNVHVNTLINNASSFFYDDFDSFDEQKWQQNFNTNLKAPWILSKAIVDNYLGQDKAGNIINIVDQQVSKISTRFLSYNLAKVGLAALTKSLAKSLAPNIRVNAVAPGLTLKPEEMDQDRFDNMVLQKTLLHKTVAPLAVAEAVWFLLGNPFITGEIINVDSGEHIA
ncbi:SDR family oxidoreductase [Rickettsiales bacterium LUAb2]